MYNTDKDTNRQGRVGGRKSSRSWKCSGFHWFGTRTRQWSRRGPQTPPPPPINTNIQWDHKKQVNKAQRKPGEDMYPFREVFLNQVERRFVDHLVLVRLQSLDLVQPSTFLNHQAQLVWFPDFIPGLAETHPSRKFTSTIVHRSTEESAISWDSEIKC